MRFVLLNMCCPTKLGLAALFLSNWIRRVLIILSMAVQCRRIFQGAMHTFLVQSHLPWCNADVSSMAVQCRRKAFIHVIRPGRFYSAFCIVFPVYSTIMEHTERITSSIYHSTIMVS